MDNKEISLLDGKVIKCLTEPILWAGVPREIFLFNVMIAVLMVMMFHFIHYIAIAAVAHLAFVYLTKREPMFFQIFFRARRLNKYFWA